MTHNIGMSLLSKKEPLKVFDLFTCLLPKCESIFLIGYYYFNNKELLHKEEEIEKYEIIGQQLLTLCVKNNLEFDTYKNINQENQEAKLLEQDIYDSNNDKINKSINPNFEIGDSDSISLSMINSSLNLFNEELEEKIIFKLITAKTQVENNPIKRLIPIEIKIPKKTQKKVPRKRFKIDYVKDCIINFIDYLPKDSNILYFDRDDFAKEKFINYKCKISSSEEKLENINYVSFVMKDDSKKYDGVWCNNLLKHYSGKDLRNYIFNLSTLIKKNGYIFISFPFGQENITTNKYTITRFDEDKFRDYFKKCNFSGLRIEKIWEDNFQNCDKLKRTINIILQKNIKVININNKVEVLPDSIGITSLSLKTIHKTTKIEQVQKLLINEDGIVKFFTPTISKIKNIYEDASQQIFFKIYRTIKSEELTEDKNIDYWELTLNAENGDVYTATGNASGSLSEKMLELNKFVKEKLNMENFWGFSVL